MKKIIRISCGLRYCLEFASFFYLFLFFMLALYWSQGPQSFGLGHSFSFDIAPKFANTKINFQTLTPLDRSLGFILSLIGLSLEFYSLRLLVRIFRDFGRQNILTAINAQRMLRFSCLLLISRLWSMPEDMLETWLLTRHAQAGEHMIRLNLSGQDFEIMLLAGLLMVIAWILVEAAKLKEEQQYTV